MDIESFVSQALIQIANGISKAQEATEEAGTLINPPLAPMGNTVQINDGNGINFIPQSIEFDLSVTVENNTAAGGEGKIRMAVLGLSAGKTSGSKDTNTSRISFSLPVCWPPAYGPEE